MSILNGRGRHGAALCVAAVVNVAMFHSVLAQDAGDGVEEVIVTAEKLGRSVMDTPASTVVLDRAELERRAGLTTTRDLLETIPNVVLSGTGNTAPVIRGIDGTGAAQGADAFFAGSRPRLNVQIDGRALSYNEIVFGDTAIWDVQQVEVLRGAQSTLQGRNAIAGTIVTKTKDPTFENEGALRVAGGNFDQQRASGVVSGPISDDVAYRLSADWMSWHSFVKQWQGFAGVKDPADFSALTLRGKLLLQPQSIAGWKTLVTLNHLDYSGPQAEIVGRPFDDRVTNYTFEPVFQPKTTGAIVDSQYELSSQLTAEAVLSGTDLSVKRKARPGDGIVNIDGREYQFEPRLNYRGEGRNAAVAGLYLFRADQDESIDFPSPQTFDDRITTAAIFGETTLVLTEQLDLIAGARYEEETHERQGGDNVSVAISLDETYRAFLPKLGLAWHVTESATVGGVVSRGYNGGGGGFTYDERSGLFTNYQYDPEYVVSYELYGRQQLGAGVQLTANVFYSNYKDMQLSYDLTPTNSTDFSYIVRNAPKAETYGAEVGATAALTRELSIYGSIGLLHAKITEYPGSGFQDNELPMSPSATASMGIAFNRDGLEASVNARYSGAYYSDIQNNPRGNVDPYWLANAQVGYRWDQLRIYGSVNNVFDSGKPVAIYSGATVAEDGASILAPRSYWLGAQWSW
jgi:outer membrane receptor protein involved in Fe transport